MVEVRYSCRCVFEMVRVLSSWSEEGGIAMNAAIDRKNRRRTGSMIVMAAVLATFGYLSLAGCAEDQPKTSSPSSKEVRGNSDRSFEKLKQEERERGKTSDGTAR